MTLGYSIDSLDICYGINLRILVTLGHFHTMFIDRNLGVLFEVLRVGLNMMNLKLFDACRKINPRILEVTLEYLSDIRVDLYVSWVLF